MDTRKLSLAGVALVLLLGACGREAMQAGSPADAAREAEERGMAFDEASEEAHMSPAPRPGSAAGQAELPAIGLAVIKTAEIRLEIAEDRLTQRIDTLTATAGRYGGFVASTEITSGERTGAHVVIRVPASSFERALSDIRGLGTVKRENVSGQDVTQEFVDMEARLRNWRAQETVLLRLMAQAQNVAESIRVQQHLQDVQLQIERIRGRLRYLEDQTAMSTIAVAMREVSPAASQEPSGGTLARAWSRAGRLVSGLISSLVYGAIVGGAVLLPLLVLALIGLVVYRVTWPRVRPSGAAKP